MKNKNTLCIIVAALIATIAVCFSIYILISSKPNEQPPSDTTVSEESSSEDATEAEETKDEEDDGVIKFAVLADFHYKKKMYASSISDLEKILKRAAENEVDFVIQVGDFCNDYIGSPELFKAYLENNYGLPVYGVYGNHELESSGNSMRIVTPRLNNRNVTFGASANGDDVGYWYTDIKGYRIIGLDTNYSYSESEQKWEHNKTASYGPPSANKNGNSLGPEQLDWLKATIADAEKQEMKVLVFSHVGFSSKWYASPDAEAVRNIFAEHEGTVMMATNGHLHTDHFRVLDNIAYFDVNTVLNGYWTRQTDYHYLDSHTYEFTNYINGEPSDNTESLPLNSLSQAKNTWFFTEPLSAIVTVSKDGSIVIDGADTEWRYDIVPNTENTGVKPQIPDRDTKLK